MAVLAAIEIEHGGRLPDGNRRTFLGRRGDVSKGIAQTLGRGLDTLLTGRPVEGIASGGQATGEYRRQQVNDPRHCAGGKIFLGQAVKSALMKRHNMLDHSENHEVDADRRDANRLPTVSIMISVYNQMHCLAKALGSALAQDYPHLEVVIGDDCSTDGAVGSEVARWQDPRIRYFRNEKNLGMNQNYRRILQDYAVGDLAIMLNADDYFIDPQFISEATNIFMQNPDVALVFGDVKVLVQATGEFFEDTANRDLPSLIDGDQLFLDYPKGYSLPHLTCLYDRRRALDIGFYTGDEISADWGSLLSLIQGKKVGYIDRTVGVLCRHRENVCKTKHGDRLFGGDIFIHKLYDVAAQHGRFSEETLNNWRNLMLRRHHTKWLIKLWFLDKSQLPEYQKMLRNKCPDIYHAIVMDMRYWCFCLIRHNNWLLRMAFKYVLKQESFVSDLIAYRSETIS